MWHWGKDSAGFLCYGLCKVASISRVRGGTWDGECRCADGLKLGGHVGVAWGTLRNFGQREVPRVWWWIKRSLWQMRFCWASIKEGAQKVECVQKTPMSANGQTGHWGCRRSWMAKRQPHEGGTGLRDAWVVQLSTSLQVWRLCMQKATHKNSWRKLSIKSKLFWCGLMA